MGFMTRLALLLKVKAIQRVTQLEEPPELLDYLDAQHAGLLQQMREALIQVAMSRRQIEAEAERLKCLAPRQHEAAAAALAAGNEAGAVAHLRRMRAAERELARLGPQLEAVAAEEERLLNVQYQLSERIEEARSRRRLLLARATAAEARTQVLEAIGGVSHEFSELGIALGRAEERIDGMLSRAAALEDLMAAGVLDGGSEPGPALPGAGPGETAADLEALKLALLKEG